MRTTIGSSNVGSKISFCSLIFKPGGSIKIKIMTNDWYAPKVGLVKSIRWEETDTDLFGKSKMVQVLDDFK